MNEHRELVNDIGTVEKQLRQFERKYGVLSNEFYQAFISGGLSEFDAYDEYRMGFREWAVLYHTRQKLEEKCQQVSAGQPAAVRIHITNTCHRTSSTIASPHPI